MQSGAIAEAQARAAVYFALAESLAEPVPGTRSVALEAATAGARVLDSNACRRAATALAASPAGVDAELRRQYREVMLPSGWRPLALFESLHRHGRLMGQAALEVEQRYRTLGLTPTNGELPDHASVELAFLGGLAAAEAEIYADRDVRLAGALRARLRREQRRFLHDHVVVWLPELGAALTITGGPFYGAIGSWLSGFLQEEASGRKRTKQRKSRLPTLIAPSACTLCGLCTGRCASGALRIQEDTSETRLVLTQSRCNSCSLCVAICPQAVLFMASDRIDAMRAESDSDASGNLNQEVLRRSPRLVCPTCGRPTVSQAEMDAVLARLNLDAEFEHRLHLCVECKMQS